jgi:hypothetical protein
MSSSSRLAWGILEGDSSNSVTTDWSGSLSVTRGAIVAERVLRFEPEDHIMRPRTDRMLLDVVSGDAASLGRSDRDDPGPEGRRADRDRAYDLPRPQQTFTISEIANIDTIFDIDAIGNQVAVTGGSCRLSVPGRLPLRNMGADRLRERSLGDAGHRGAVGTRVPARPLGRNNEGKKVFFESTSRKTEVPRLAARNVDVGDGRGNGWFRGFWCDADGEPIGSPPRVWMHDGAGPTTPDGTGVSAERLLPRAVEGEVRAVLER